MNNHPSEAENALQVASGDATKLLVLLKQPGRLETSRLQDVWRAHDPDAWGTVPEIYHVLGQRFLKLGEPLLAYDVAAEGIKSRPKDVPARQLLALALARSGAPSGARVLLEELAREGCRDEETLGLLARTHKDLARESPDAAEVRRHLRQAYEYYAQAFQATRGYWSGINTATLLVQLEEREQAASVAREVSRLCREKLIAAGDSSPERYWLLSTLGEVALILEQWEEAEDWYGKAVELGRGDWGSLQSTRHNARVLLGCLAVETERIERLFQFPSVVAFTGHMMDLPGRQPARFPPEAEEMVKCAIRRRLKEIQAGFGYASAACGADILFHEVIQEMKAESHVILPFPSEVFVQTSVATGVGANWTERFWKVRARAADVLEISSQGRVAGGIAYEFANLTLHGLASLHAEQLQTELVPLAVWDGRTGDGPGGTSATVERWRKLGLTVEIIDLNKVALNSMNARPGEPLSEPQDFASLDARGPLAGFSIEIRALLFADVEGFSKLNDDEIPRFVRHFLGLVGELTSNSAHPPLMRNTWGDGLYFVFPTVHDAGLFALDLRDAVCRVDWPAKGLPRLNLRIGLHAGPVFSCVDPVTERPNYIGAHVSRAARIEPITPSGQVYTSQAFAALAAADGVKEFRCDYVGQTSMAKKYGTFPTYVVLRRHAAS